MYNIFNKYKSGVIFLIKLIIVGSAFYLISQKVITNNTLFSPSFLNGLQANLLSHATFFILIILLTLSNWLLEIFKWQTLISTIKHITFFQASKQSLSSLTASLLTPNRIGEYGVKAIHYPKNKRTQVMFLNFLGHFSQMFATILFGLLGFVYLGKDLTSHLQLSSYEALVFILIITLITIFLFKKYWLKYWLKITDHIKVIPNKIHFNNHLLSIIRYLIFSHQFYLLLFILGSDINYLTAMSLIFCTYLIASILPGFVVFDWVIKGSVAVTLFQFFGVNEIIILSITSLMWLLNFALPSIVGSYFVLTFNHKNLVLKENRIHS